MFKDVTGPEGASKQSDAGGVVAAGSPETVRAGTEILQAGGTAADAAIACAFAACAAEPHLIALGAGGFMLTHDAATGRQTLLDYFVAMPGEGLEKEQRKLAKLTPTPVDFGSTVQMFHSGHAANGVPGFVAGMYAAHERFGTLPMARLLEPAQRIATEGVVVGEQQSYLFELLHNILTLTEDSKRRFAKDGGPYRKGDTFRYPELAETLAEIAAGGADTFYRGALAERIVRESAAGGGRITAADLAAYEVIERDPVRIEYRGSEIVGNPPPSSGGALIAHTLRLLSHFDLAGLGRDSYERLRHVVEAQLATNTVRRVRFDAHLHDEDVLERLLAEEQVVHDHQGITNRLGNTTHCVVIDGNGNAVSMTNSNGACSGVQVPGTGIQLNSMLGEEDLNPQGFHKHPVGSRIPSMMAPTLVLDRGEVRLAVGSAGSNRIRSAILQTILGVLDDGLPLDEAVEAPRVHVEGDSAEIEGGIDPKHAKRLTADGYQVNLWKDRNLFFGGVQAAVRNPRTGTLTGHGDTRRGGAAMTV